MASDLPQVSPGDTIPSHFDPRLVVTAYFASLCGCFLTIETLHRRKTGLGNLASWFHTLSCASFMSVIGIWSMHYIGNRAIILGNGEKRLQLVCSPGFTGLSVALPLVGLTLAFTVAEYPFHSSFMHWLSWATTGIIAGLSIAGMHYIGNFAISNYHLQYRVRFVVASFVISVAYCPTIMMLFYAWREKWINSGLKRVSCAMLLAGAVSAMHFTASTDCIYKFKHFGSDSNIRMANVNLIIAGACCGAAICIVLCILWKYHRKALGHEIRSHQVTVACVWELEDGRILVMAEGKLPCRLVTEKYEPCTFSDEFDITHPVFHWIYRVSHHWASVIDLVPKMKEHLRALKRAEKGFRPNLSDTNLTFDSSTYNDHSVVFREKFCATVAQMALDIHVPISSMGTLFEKIIETGIPKSEASLMKRVAFPKRKETQDTESGLRPKIFSKGQLLLLIRSLSTEEAERLVSVGFKFASYEYLKNSIAEQFQIPQVVLDEHFRGLRAYRYSLEHAKVIGTYLSFFAMVPKLNRGFDILVRKEATNSIPDTQLMNREPVDSELQILHLMNGETPQKCISLLEEQVVRDSQRAAFERGFATHFIDRLVQFSRMVPTHWFERARFCAEPLQAHYTRPLDDRSPPTTVFAFVVCADLYSTLNPQLRLVRTPLSLLNVRHACYAGSPNHNVLATEIHCEFGSILSRSTAQGKSVETTDNTNKGNSSQPFFHNWSMLSNGRNRNRKGKRNSRRHTHTSNSPTEIFEMDLTTSDAPSNDFGGILVNSEMVVESVSKKELDPPENSGCCYATNEVEIGTTRYVPTFIDFLMATTQRMLPPMMNV